MHLGSGLSTFEAGREVERRRTGPTGRGPHFLHGDMKASVQGLSAWQAENIKKGWRRGGVDVQRLAAGGSVY